MKAAPGSQLPIQDIVGREVLIADLWRLLETSSLRVEAERRIGKTHILHKMEAEPPEGWVVISLDLENVHSADEFAEVVSDKVDRLLKLWSKAGRRIHEIFHAVGGAAVGPLKFPEKKDRPEGYWKKLLTSSIEDLVEQQAAVGKRAVFLFDEMPWMISAIADPQRDGERTAMEVLDVLRALRQSPTTGRGFRMVLCGSVGMHHVLGSLRKQGYKNQPVNDMRLVEVKPLDRPDAEGLAARLLDGEGLKAEPEVPVAIAEQTGGFPFYIHWVVSELRMGVPTAMIRLAEVEEVLKKLLTAPHDPCGFRQFLSRIEGYYPGQERVVLALLDHAAASSAPLDQAEFLNVARVAGASEDNQIRELLRLLAVDHYLSRDSDGRYHFRHALLRRWWVIEQGLN